MARDQAHPQRAARRPFREKGVLNFPKVSARNLVKGRAQSIFKLDALLTQMHRGKTLEDSNI